MNLRKWPALLGALALGSAGLAGLAEAQTRADVNGTIVSGVYDTSNATHAHVYCQITVTATATSLSSLLSTVGCTGIPPWASMAFVTPETAAIRYRADLMAPTASAGQPILQNQAWPIQSQLSLTTTQLISTTGGAVTVDVEFRG